MKGQKKFKSSLPTIGEIIKEKNYDYISYRIEIPKKDAERVGASLSAGVYSIFAGAFSVKNGQITSLDGDDYDYDEKVVLFEEWNDKNLQRGATIVVTQDNLRF